MKNILIQTYIAYKFKQQMMNKLKRKHKIILSDKY